jgi:hypothetical protein
MRIALKLVCFVQLKRGEIGLPLSVQTEAVAVMVFIAF